MADSASENPPFDWVVLDRYFAGEGTASERAAIDRWILAYPGRGDFLEELKGLSEDPHATHKPVDVRADWQTLHARIAGQGTVYTQEGHERVSRSRIFPRTRPRAGKYDLRRIVWSTGSIVVAAVAYVMFTYHGHRETTLTRTYATQSGQQATFTLTDGTRVTLAPRTTLQLIRFGASSRSITLDGQAYFEVARSAGAPFLVHSGSVTTQVLGTAFLVRHYANDGQVHVAVTEGKVTVVPDSSHRTKSSSRLTLTAGHIGDVTDSTIFTSTVDDLTKETDWLRGRLVFQEASVLQVLQTLSRWYGYQFRCADSSLTKQNVTVALDGRSSAAALAMLEQLLDVRLTMTGDTVTLISRPRRSTKGPAHKQEYDVWSPTREVGR